LRFIDRSIDRSSKAGFVGTYSGNGELLRDAKALGVGSIDDIASGLVVINAKGNGVSS
jgi:hypothetical protein